jgi:hypothetical protein
MKLTKILETLKNKSYTYGCVMLYVDFPQLPDVQSIINKSDIYTGDGYGLESEPHCTLLYGLHSDEIDDTTIKKIIESYTFPLCRAYLPSVFSNDEYDVLKFNVESDNIRNINTQLRKLPHTTSYPIYRPHLTVGYLNPRTGMKYVDMLNTSSLNSFTLKPTKVVYSKPSGDRIEYSIKT